MTLKPKETPEAYKRRAVAMTSYIMRKHYCENDIESILSTFDDRFFWFGTGENEAAIGAEKVKAIFRQFAGKVPKCNICDEEYEACALGPDIYLCVGRMWIATDPSTGVYLRVHQRVTMIFRKDGGKLRCCHIHISNPYEEMTDGDIGFPTNMARQSHEYLQQCLEAQKRQIAAQTAELDSIYNTVPCAILRLLRKDGKYRLLTFNRALADLLCATDAQVRAMDWSCGFSHDISAEDSEKMAESLASLKFPGDSSSVDYRLYTHEGKRLYLSSSNTLISDDGQGQVIQRIAFDITRRREMEEMLQRLSYEDSLTGLLNRNRFNREMRRLGVDLPARLGVACFDINGLKAMNDREGHSSGDQLIRQAAGHLRRVFADKAYRTGGDEFVVIDTFSSRDAFSAAVEVVHTGMKRDGVNVSVGISWRDANCNIKEQFDEADQRMYDDKKNYYSNRESVR